jgi:HK97 family phage major capsid protein/HK97 family phage prohead protease
MAVINGTEIDLMPTAGMREEAQRYRDWKSEGEGGGTEVAARRATQILSGNELSPDVVIQMSAWFARHEVDKQGEGFSPGEDGYPSNGRVAWAAWGGDAGKSFSDAKSARIKELRNNDAMPKTKRTVKRAEPDALSVGDYVRWNASGGTARGQIDRIVRDGTINVPNSSFEITGTEDDPAALITVFRENDGEYEATDVQVGHKFSTLTKIDSLRSVTKVLKRSGETSFSEKEENTYEFSFSSTYPVERSFGTEILSHDDGAIDFGRLNGGVAPVLWNHNMDSVIGIVRNAYLDKEKKKGRAVVELSRNAKAQEVKRDIDDGILSSISVGYRILEMEEREIDGNNAFLATRWEPHEVSVVASPAAPDVGISRGLIDDNTMPSVEKQDIVNSKRVYAASTDAQQPNSKQQLTMEKEQLDLEVVRSEERKKAASAERTRIREINAMCSKRGFDDLAEQLVNNGSSVDSCRQAILERIDAKPVETAKPIEEQLSPQERKQYAKDYRLSAGIRGLITNDWSDKASGFAREISQQIAKDSGKGTRSGSLFIPYSGLVQRATYVTSGATTGGNIVATDLLADDFIEALRNSTVMVGLGVQTLSGLVGDVAIPRRSGVASTGFLSSETAALSQAESTFDQISMTPKTLGTLSKFSRNMLIQATPGIEDLVRRDISDGINLGIDLGILNGTGSSGQPTGIMQTSGIGSVAIGTNGGAITVDKLIDLETAIMEDNAGVNADSISYVTNAKVMGAIKKLKTSGGEYLVNNNLQALGRGATPVAVNGYPLAMTNQVPSNLTKGSTSGSCSAVVMGDFSQAILGLYGSGIEITAGEDSDDFAKNLVSVKGVVAFDVAVRHAQSFAAILDVTT